MGSSCFFYTLELGVFISMVVSFMIYTATASHAHV